MLQQDDDLLLYLRTLCLTFEKTQVKKIIIYFALFTIHFVCIEYFSAVFIAQTRNGRDGGWGGFWNFNEFSFL